MSTELCPALQQQFVDANGNPLAGGQLYSYAAGTIVPLATYTDFTGLTANTNPIILNSEGYAPVWIGNNSYKFALYDANNNLQFTVDNVMSIASQIAAITTTFQSVSISYVQFQTASLSNAVVAFTLPANSLLEYVAIKHSIAFAGTSITDVYAQVGPSGAYQNIISNFDVFQSVADQTFDNISPDYIGSFANPTLIYVNLTSVGANLSALSQGSLTIYYKYETL